MAAGGGKREGERDGEKERDTEGSEDKMYLSRAHPCFLLLPIKSHLLHHLPPLNGPFSYELSMEQSLDQVVTFMIQSLPKSRTLLHWVPTLQHMSLWDPNYNRQYIE